MKLKFLNQLEFSTLLFDTIFGLILFYSFDALFNITKFHTLVFYLFSMFILVHWWLIFKSTDDSFDEEVTDSAADIVFGIIYTIILYYFVQYSRSADYKTAIAYLLGLFAIDFLWSVIWRYVGKWRTTDQARIKTMERILEKGIALDVIFGLVFAGLFVVRGVMTDWLFIGASVAVYFVYMGMTFKLKTLNIDIF